MTDHSDSDFQSYYGQPVIKEPVWKPVIPVYFFTGGLGGASAALAFGAQLVGNKRLARNATLLGLLNIGISPVLLIVDLGKPSRFYNMLRMFKLTSPMSVGSWLISGLGAALGVAGFCELFGVLPKLKLAAQAVAALFGLPVSTYTAALIADTAVPAWHDARRELPFVFAGGAAASAGAAALIVTPSTDAGPARLAAIGGAMLEAGAAQAMERRLGKLVGEPYRTSRAGSAKKASAACTLAGGAITTFAGGKRLGAIAGGSLLLAGALLERWTVYEAGLQSARDPKYTIVPQRERIESRGTMVTTRPQGTRT
ncbi:MAG TPA: NrfD/PsrC family molybdoenzyme membrane anchor subunit [Dehalococcoidia bacterium]|nr:NrfD/PsrC family molybdoenzyme membrane anchor subunit [Dehalococcoidia bacterium]